MPNEGWRSIYARFPRLVIQRHRLLAEGVKAGMPSMAERVTSSSIVFPPGVGAEVPPEFEGCSTRGAEIGVPRLWRVSGEDSYDRCCAGGWGGVLVSPCLMIRFRSTSLTCSAGREAARVEARVFALAAVSIAKVDDSAAWAASTLWPRGPSQCGAGRRVRGAVLGVKGCWWDDISRSRHYLDFGAS